MIVFRMALRELWRARWRLALLALVLALQVMAIGGAYVSMHAFDVTRETYYSSLSFADLEVTFTPAAEGELPSLDKIRKIPGVRGVARRYVMPGTIENDDAPPWPVVIVYLEPGPQEVNALAVLDGRALDPASPQGALVDRSFAEYRHVKIGDRIVVDPYRFATRFTVTGIGLSPEFLAPAVDPGFLMPAKGSLGILYAPRAQLDQLFTEKLYNDLVVTYAPGADPDATKAAVTLALKGIDVQEVIPRKANVGFRLLEELLRTPRVLAPILALVVGLLAAIVAYVLMTRIIASQRREIGALLAIGFPAWHFVAGYLLLGLAPGVFGAAVGVELAMLFGRAYSHSQAALIGFPDPIVVAPWWVLAKCALFAVTVTLAGALVPLVSVLRMTPQAAMRGGHEITFRGLPRALERIVAHGRATFRYTVRNVLRRTRLSAAVVMLVCAGIAAPATLLTTNTSWETWSEEMGARIRWDATVSFRVPLDADSLAVIASTPGLHAFETFAQGRATLTREGALTHEVRVRGMKTGERLDARELTAGRELAADDALEAIVDEGLARGERPVALGEKVHLTTNKGTPLDLTVVGTVHEAAAATVHVPLATAQKILGVGDKVTGMFVLYGPMSERAAPPPRLPDAGARPDGAEEIDLGDDEKPDDTAHLPPPPPPEAQPKNPETALLRNEMVVGLQSREAAVSTTRRFMREQRGAIFPFLGVAMFFAFAAIVSVLAILLLERETEYATLRAMGYGRAGITRIVSLEVLVLASLGLFAALTAWLVLSAYLIASISKSLFPIPLTWRAADFVVVASPTVAFLALSAAAGVRAVLRINLRETLCSRTIE